MTAPTLCVDCDNRFVVNKSDEPHRWLCIKHKRLPTFGFVTDRPWERFPPYLYCNNVNGGCCPFWTPARGDPVEE